MNFTSCLDRRLEQHKREEDIDEKLQQLDCKENVLRYFAWRREVNRNSTNTTSFWSALTKFQTNMDEIDNDYNTVLNIINSENPCENLRNYIDP